MTITGFDIAHQILDINGQEFVKRALEVAEGAWTRQNVMLCSRCWTPWKCCIR